jgi:hypothetical protein
MWIFCNIFAGFFSLPLSKKVTAYPSTDLSPTFILHLRGYMNILLSRILIPKDVVVDPELP